VATEPVKKVEDASTEAKRQELRLQMERAAALERTSGSSGAIPNAPKQSLLDASDVQAKHPNLRLRWLNVNNAEKMAVRQASGYSRLSMEEGGRQVGNLALFGLPKEEYDRRVKEIERRNKERLSSHRTEVEQMAESVAKSLRDNHGIRVDAERILIKE
jgi:hypothetical protein